MRWEGLSPPCCVDSRGTHGPNPHGFWHPHNLQVPIPIPTKTHTREHGYGFRRVWVWVLVELPMGYPWQALVVGQSHQSLQGCNCDTKVVGMSVSNWLRLRCKLEAVDKNQKNWKNGSRTYEADLLRSAKCYAHDYLCSFHFMVLQEVNIDKVLSSHIFSTLGCIYRYPKQYKLSPNSRPSGHIFNIPCSLYLHHKTSH